jgi:hypothetical protein
LSTKPEAGLDETGFGRSTDNTVLNGITKDGTYGDVYQDEMVAEDLAQRMAALTVHEYAGRVGLSEDDRNDLLDMLELPREFIEPTEYEKTVVARHLPKVSPMDTRSPNNHLVPERRGWNNSQVW